MRLCYIDGPWAYFTAETQKGDDWNDVPYEHNAGEPYGDFIRLGFHDGTGSGYLRPCEFHCNSPWSVDDINAGAAPWLRTVSGGILVTLKAGATIPEFVRWIETTGGIVYVPRGFEVPA